MGNINFKLYEEINKGDMQGIKNILEANPDIINSYFNKERTSNPLIRAIYLDNIDVVKYLIEKGANLNISINTFNGAFPLVIACIKGNLEIIKLLIESGAEFNNCDGNGYTPLDHCVIRGFYNCSQYLISKGFRLKSEDFYNRESERFITKKLIFSKFIQELNDNKEYSERDTDNWKFEKCIITR